MIPPRRIETPRLVLRPPAVADAEAIYTEYASDPLVTHFLTWPPHASLEETREFLDRLLTNPNEPGVDHRWAIEPREERGRAVGMIGVRLQPPRADLGYVLGRRFWGRGLMTEAVRAVADWALSQPELHRVWAVCDVDNPASARVMEKAGMQYEGRLRRWSLHPNVSAVPRDCLCYSRVKEA